VVVLSACRQELLPEELVRARAEARWQAMKAGDYDKAYEFLAPGFRSRVTPDSYRGRFVGKTEWQEATLGDVTCDHDVCEVSVSAKYRFLGAPPFPPMESQTQQVEKWVYTQDDWWHVPRR
jgi:hypothetical protein